MSLVSLEQATTRSRVQHSTTERLSSQSGPMYITLQPDTSKGTDQTMQADLHVCHLHKTKTKVLTTYLINSLHWVIFQILFSSIITFKNTIRVSNSLDPDQARQNVGPNLDPNYLQWL